MTSMRNATHIPPNAKRLIHALRSIGYSIEKAIADVVDNSIDASAQNVLVRIRAAGEAITDVLIIDDGVGMTGARIEEAMRFGAETDQGPDSLGKFGMGMKLASLSQARELTVSSRKDGETNGRKWTIAGIESGWNCETLSREEAHGELEGPWEGADTSKSGTVVRWSDLDRVRAKAGGLQETVDSIVHRLRFHLGIHLHRFLEDHRVRIRIDTQEEGEDESTSVTVVEPLDPFGYETTGDPEFPRSYELDLPEGRITLDAHIWPANDSSRNYKLDNRVSSRQGLYFYRNDRLVQAGGWSHFRDAEPHMSLARVAIDLPPSMESAFHLDMKKSSIDPPASFRNALSKAVDKQKRPFTQYLNAAQKAYRKEAARNPDNHPLVPGAGIPAQLRETARNILAPDTRKVREVEFEWADLQRGLFFEIDREHSIIRLSRSFRNVLLGGRRAGGADAPLIKVLLFLLLAEDLDSARVSKRQQERLDQFDSVLKEAVKTMKVEE